MLSRRTLLKTSAFAVGAAGLDLSLLAGPVARTGAASTLIELDRNENPHGPSPAARKAMIERIERGNRYLDSDELNLFRDQIATREGVARENIVLGSGSSEILWMAAREFLSPGKTLLLGDPTFELIGRVAELGGATLEKIPVGDDQGDHLDRFDAKRAPAVKLVYLCWPNNPCGSMVPANDMRAFVSKAARTAPVLVDEAYLEYADGDLKTSMVDRVRAGEDVIVARTFSKIHGLAGMRMGYAIALPETAKRLAQHRFSVLNSLALAGASAALDDRGFQELSRKRNDEGKKVASTVLDELGIRYVPSSTSFVWFHEGDRKLAGPLRERNILIPNGRFAGGWNRVTIGTAEEMARWAEAMRDAARA
ncbi:MAG TPA: aminotransferase class I/II-fold pyridoxal phosphate-dependent enzyme [Thermoanaerobaculia bacterium]